MIYQNKKLLCYHHPTGRMIVFMRMRGDPAKGYEVLNYEGRVDIRFPDYAGAFDYIMREARILAYDNRMVAVADDDAFDEDED